MNPSFITLILIALLCIYFTSCQRSEGVSELTSSQNIFAQHLFKRINGSGNVVISPMSIHTALFMSTLGARGKTLQELQSALRLHIGGETLLEVYNSRATLNGETSKFANAMWIDRTLQVLEQYGKVVQEYFGSQAKHTDFKSRPAQARQEINEWVEDKTSIKDFIPENVITSSTRLLLANAIRFKGKWNETFRKEDTKPVLFHGKIARRVPMMHKKGSLEYYQERDINGIKFKILTLPFENDNFRMTFLLPETGTLEQLRNAVSNNLTNILVESTKQKVELKVIKIPKFTIRWENDVTNALQKMGIKRAFDFRANFSGITRDEKIHISAINHSAFMQIDEEGSNAGAATGVVLAPTSYQKDTRPHFVLNKPFFFLVSTKANGVLFVGHVENL